MEVMWGRVAIGVLVAVTALATLAGRGHSPGQRAGGSGDGAPSGQTEVFLLEPNGTARRLDDGVRALLAGPAGGGRRPVLVSLPLRDRTLRWQGSTVATAQLSPDGTRVITTGQFPVPEIRPVWQSTDALIDYAYDCCVWRDLTPEEREVFGLPMRDS